MAIKDLVYETTSTSGTADFAPAGAKSAEYRTIASAHSSGEKLHYVCRGGAQWEVGEGTWNGTVLARTTVYDGSSGAGIKVNFASGVKELYETMHSGSILDISSIPASITFEDGDKVLVLKADGSLQTILGSIIKAAGTGGGGTPAVTAPGAPTIGTMSAGDGTVSQAFSAPASNGGSAITGYTLTVYRTSDNTVVTTATGVSSPIAATVANGTQVYGKVKATNSAGTGAESAASNNATPAAASGPVYVLSNFTKGDSTPFPTTGTMTSAGSESYADTAILIRIKTAANTVPPNDAIKFVWGKSSTVCPVADYSATSVPTNSGNGNTSTRTNSIGAGAKAGSWSTTADPAFGNYRNAATFYAWGTPGVWYLWVLTSDGFIGVAKDAQGNPATWTLS